MAENADVVDNNQTLDQVIEPEYSPKEQEALSMGWKPKSEWQGEEDDFIDAREFVRRKSLFDKIESQGKQLKELKNVLDTLKEHNSKIEQYTRKQVLEELRNVKKQALADGDADKLAEVDEAIMQYKIAEKEQQEQDKKEAQQQQTTLDPAFVAWKNRNTWFDSDKELQDYAVTVGMGYKGRFPDATADVVLSYVEREVKERFKSKFENPNRKKASSVEPPNGGEGGSNKKGKYSPSDDERKIAKSYVRQGVFKTEDEYYAQLAQMNG